MSKTANNNKRIAKNTIFLYFRMLFIMAVNLYTSRIILNTLGVVDYGIFNVVAGIITMLGFITGPLGGTASRYITFALGEGNFEKLKRIFGSTVMVQIIMAAILFSIAESFGLWFVMNKLVIPSARFSAALWIYQFSVVTAIVSLLSVPYNAAIIAHEKMDAFAYISIFEVLAKLCSVILLNVISYDHLIIYGALLLVIQVVIRIIYTLYCKNKFMECKYPIVWKWSLIRELFAYASWCSLGYLAVVGYTQGLNVLLNLFFGPAVNAARAIAVQVQSAIMQLCANFQMALNPQITKSYASGDFDYMQKLIFYSSKYSYFIMLIIIVPLMLNIQYVLGLWLGEVPDHTVAFLRLTLIIALLECMKNPILTAIHATGKIKFFQTIEGFCLISIVPLAYLLLHFTNESPEIVFKVYLFVEAFTQIIRLIIILPRIKMSFIPYIKAVLLPVAEVSIVVSLIFICFRPSVNFGGLISSSFQIIILETITVLVLGLNKKERNYIYNHVKSIISRNHGKK